mmetsp:Transcript_95712/g.247440  ORF Transcript_95712/g.247440 Transcript_95712/m.247440 type:complete len:281 (-) Transcript_95712:1402-2244(-)
MALGRELDLADATHDLGVGLQGRRGLERRMAGHELEDEDAQSPPVDGFRVPGRRNELGCEVVRGPAGGVRPADGKLCKAHVRDLEVPGLSQQEVLRLQVPVNDPLLVDVLKGEDGARDVEEGVALAAVEALAVVRGVELAAQRRLHQEVQGLIAAVRLVELDDEVRVEHQHKLLLVHDTVLHAHLHDVALAERLHGVRLAVDFVLVQLDNPEAAAAQEAYPRQVVLLDPRPVRFDLRQGGIGTLALAEDALSLRLLAVALLARADDLLQGAEQHVEGVAV